MIWQFCGSGELPEMVVVSDTSAISALLQIGRAEMLQDLYGDLIIPSAVEIELRRSHPCIPDFIKVLAVEDCPALQLRCVTLDKGEAHAITLAEQLQADLLLIDERKGRLAADEAGICYIGLVGALIEAKRRGVITNLGDLLSLIMTHAGFRLSETLRIAVLRSVGEIE